MAALASGVGCAPGTRRFSAARQSVRALGAAGDGIANDTAPFQRALDYAASGAASPVVYVPAGIYSVDPLTIGSGVTLEGEGATSVILAHAHDSRPLLRNRGGRGDDHDILIRRLVLDGNRTLWPKAGDRAPSRSALAMERVIGLRLESVTVTDVYCIEAPPGGGYQAGVLLRHCDGASVSGMKGSGCFQSALYLVDCDDCDLTDNRFEANGGSGITSTRIRGCRVTRCTAERSGDAAMTTLVFSGISINGSNCVVSDCVSRHNTGSGFAIGHDNSDLGDRADRVSAATVSRCVATDNHLDGFTIASGTPDDMWRPLGTISRCEARDNRRYGFKVIGGHGAVLEECLAEGNEHGIRLEGPARAHIVRSSKALANRIHGISASRVDDLVIDDCDALDNGSDSDVGAGLGIDDLSAPTIRSSRLADTRTGDARTQEFGIWFGGNTGVSEIVMRGNRIENNRLQAVRETGSVRYRSGKAPND